MKRIVIVGLIVVLVLGVAGYFLNRYFRGLRDTDTNIAIREAYDGPATMPSAVEDWPRWRGPRGDGISREVIADTWPEGGPKVLWSADVGLGYSSPIAHQGKIYLFHMHDERETLTCFDALNGQILWSEPDPDKGWTKSYPGARATPAIHGNSIYTYGGTGILLSRDIANGKTEWHRRAVHENSPEPLDWGQASSPLATEEFIYVQNGQGGPVALAFDHGADLRWRSQAHGVGGYASPILINADGVEQLVVFGGDAIWGMNPLTGQTIWNVSWDTKYAVNASTPIYRDGHLFVTSAYDEGSIMLKVTGSGVSKLWMDADIQSRFQPPILDGDLLFVNSEGTIKCMKWPTQELHWTAKDSKLRLGVGGSMLRVADKFILLHERGILSLAKADANGIQLISQFTPTRGSQVWATPLLYGGRLYVKGEAELFCFDATRSVK